jgi:hypothetical protein
MIIKWPGLLGLNTNMALDPTVLAILQIIFPSGVNEGVAIEVIQSSIDFGQNEIPTATVQVAVGRLADDDKVLSAIHYLIKHLKLFLSVSLYSKITTKATQGVFDKWPVNPDGTAKPFRVFDGHIVGTGFRQTSQGIEFQCSIIHWLSDLNFSSTLSRSSSPQNPGQISFDPNLPQFPNSGARNANLFTQGSALTQAMPIINPDTLMKDFWGKTVDLPVDPARPVGVAAVGVGGLKQWFTEVCMNDRINWRQIEFGSCVGAIAKPTFEKNVEALSALSRIEPLSNGYIDGVPLAMDNRPGISNLAAQIATQIGFETFDIHNHTIWDKLVGQFGVSLMFTLVPQVEKALIVPFSPGLRRPWATVFANDYDYFERSDIIPRPLRGIGLFVGREFAAGGHASLNNRPIYNTVGAYYENPNRKNGLVVWKEAPRWLSTVVLPHMYTPAFKGTGAANAFNAGGGNVPKEPPPKCKIEQQKAVWCDYARALYIQEILRGRTGRLSGRLRFDIAPGSIIRIEEPEEQFVLSLAKATRSYIYAQVVRVSCVMNSESRKAGTAIQFAFSRDEAENQDPSYSLDRHPLWMNNWYGAPLVNDPAFYPGGPPGVSPPEKVLSAIANNGCAAGGTLPGNVQLPNGQILPPIPPIGFF